MAKVLCSLALALLLRADESVDALAVYKTGDYSRAVALLRAAAGKNPQDPSLQAALLSTLVYQGHVDEAADVAAEDAHQFPESAEVLAARGDFSFYMGDLPTAETLYKTALKLKDDNARANYGLYRIYRAASMYRSARLLCLRAHTLDPDDALITLAYMRYLAPQKRREDLPEFVRSHPWF